MPRYGLKKSYKKKSKPLKAARFSKTKRDALVQKMRMVAKQTLNRNIETKTSQQTSSDGIEILHNNFVTVNSALLATAQGTADHEGGIGHRIGDQINLKGVSLKFMLELNERYSDVTFRILVVKCARGDPPTRGTLFNNESGNKMMDTIRSERYTVLAQKFIKITAPNRSVWNPAEHGGLLPSGVYADQEARYNLSRASKICKMWIPGTKFGRRGVIQYEDAQSVQKFFDYHVVVYAYSNYSTGQDLYNVGRVNEFLSKMYYKDG